MSRKDSHAPLTQNRVPRPVRSLQPRRLTCLLAIATLPACAGAAQFAEQVVQQATETALATALGTEGEGGNQGTQLPAASGTTEASAPKTAPDQAGPAAGGSPPPGMPLTGAQPTTGSTAGSTAGPQPGSSPQAPVNPPRAVQSSPLGQLTKIDEGLFAYQLPEPLVLSTPTGTDGPVCLVPTGDLTVHTLMEDDNSPLKGTRCGVLHAATNSKGEAAFIVSTRVAKPAGGTGERGLRRDYLGRYIPGGAVTLRELPGGGRMENASVQFTLPSWSSSTSLRNTSFTLTDDGTVMFQGTSAVHKDGKTPGGGSATAEISANGQVRLGANASPLYVGAFGSVEYNHLSQELLVRFHRSGRTITIGSNVSVPGLAESVGIKSIRGACDATHEALLFPATLEGPEINRDTGRDCYLHVSHSGYRIVRPRAEMPKIDGAKSYAGLLSLWLLGADSVLIGVRATTGEDFVYQLDVHGKNAPTKFMLTDSIPAASTGVRLSDGRWIMKGPKDGDIVFAPRHSPWVGRPGSPFEVVKPLEGESVQDAARRLQSLLVRTQGQGRISDQSAAFMRGELVFGSVDVRERLFGGGDIIELAPGRQFKSRQPRAVVPTAQSARAVLIQPTFEGSHNEYRQFTALMWVPTPN